MDKCRIAALAAAVVFAVSAAGCADKSSEAKETEEQTEATSHAAEQSVADESSEENGAVEAVPPESLAAKMMNDRAEKLKWKFGYNGTFDEDVADVIASEIIIGDRTFSLPFTLDDLGEDFVYSKPYISEHMKDWAITDLYLDGKKLAHVTFHDKHDHDYSQDGLESVEFDKEDTDALGIKVGIGGFEYGDTLDVFKQCLGEPSESDEYAYEGDYRYYCENYFLIARIDYKDGLNHIEIHKELI